MRDILTEIDRWHAQGKRIALATVIATWGSSPRAPGSRMAITVEGEFAGSVSGGCVEAAVIEAAVATLEDNRPQLLHFGVADDTAWQVGLACGGSVDVFVNPLDTEMFREVRAALAESAPAALITVVGGPVDILGRELLLHSGRVAAGSLGAQRDAAALVIAKDAVAEAATRRTMLDAEVDVFVDVILPPLTLVVIGGVHVARPLIAMARSSGYATVLIDPRASWGNSDRFAGVDRLLTAWPEDALQQIELTPRTAVVALTHDPKLDDPSLKIALQSPAFYVGALGSRVTQADRRERLRRAGLTDEQLSRLHAPIGLPIGAETPEEIAVAIMAEIVATLHTPRPTPEPARAAVVSSA